MNTWWAFIPILMIIFFIPGLAPAPTKCQLATAWSATTFDQNECLEPAEKALRKTGYYKNFSVAGQSVFGANEENEQASIRCLPRVCSKAFSSIKAPSANN